MFSVALVTPYTNTFKSASLYRGTTLLSSFLVYILDFCINRSSDGSLIRLLLLVVCKTQQYMQMEEGAIPLCLPSNYSWDENTNECVQHGKRRSTLKVIDTALRRLQAIQGPVCVVAVAGPCRQGKSFILCQPFVEDREIFPLGHSMDPKTVGIWMWIVPEKHQECTVVLIDSEGTDSPSVSKSDDGVIFTLAVLLSSVLIYNCSTVPRRSNLIELRYPFDKKS